MIAVISVVMVGDSHESHEYLSATSMTHDLKTISEVLQLLMPNGKQFEWVKGIRHSNGETHQTICDILK